MTTNDRKARFVVRLRRWPLTIRKSGLALVVALAALAAFGLGGQQVSTSFGRPAQANSSQQAPHQHGDAGEGVTASCPPVPAAPVNAPPRAEGAPAPMLIEPEVVRSENGVLRTTLTVAAQNVQIGDRMVTGRVYNGAFVGPTLRVRPGDRIELTLGNCLAESTNIHFHGMNVSPNGFGDNIFRTVDPGVAGGYMIDIPSDHPTGTFWYHAHVHGRTTSQVFGGLSGMIVVEGLRDLLPPELRDITEHTIALKDYREIDGAIPSDGITIGAPTTRTVNGQVQPQFQIRPGETQLLRIGNIGANITYLVRLEGHSFRVIGEDGTPVWAVVAKDELVLPAGKRFDVLIQGEPVGVYALETLPYDTGPDGNQFPQATLAWMVSQGEGRPAASLPMTLDQTRDLSSEPIARQREIVFSEDTETNLFFINGKTFDHDRVDVTAQFGTVEEWTIRNVSKEEHPFHIHQVEFQVMSVNGDPYDAHGLQDVVMLPSEGEVVVRIPFREYTGTWVFHCHILNHEDAGMMATIEVVP
ncbi:MAG: multicopper oxidase family protein [Dehalococcoidia bacterium]